MTIFKDKIIRRFNFEKFCIVLLLLIPVFIYAFLVSQFSINIPWYDDYDAVLSYLLSNPSNPSQFFAQHNEHRIAWTRFVVGSYYRVFGEINFKHMIYIGNMAMLFIWLIMLKISSEKKIPILLFVPLTYFLFQLQQWENMTWAMASLQNYYILLFALLAIYFWNKKSSWGYCLSLIFGIIATYTSANGLIVFFVLLFWEARNVFRILKSNPRSVRKQLMREQGQFFSLFLITALMCYVYFNGYIKPYGHPSLIKVILDPFLSIQYVVIFLGSYMELMGKEAVLWAGRIEIIFFIFLMYKRYDKKNPVVYYFLLFNLLSVFIVALGRAGFGLHQALAPRYRTPGHVVLVLTYFAFVESFLARFISKKIVVYLLVVLAISLNFASAPMGIRKLKWRRYELIKGVVQWKFTGQGLSYLEDSQERSSSLLKQAVERKIYHLPEAEIREGIKSLRGHP